MLSDIQIAQSAKMKPIREVAEKIGISEEYLEYYGKYKAKISEDFWQKIEDKPSGKLVLVTAINPTPAGEGKTTTSVGLGQALCKIGKNAVIALREPSLGPVMGIKGGAAGGGYAQVVPMEDINLHFTGDMHAITSACNLLSAAIDNLIHQGNALKIDVRRILWKRAMDMNDRALRNIIVGLGGKINGFPREDGFMITVASEVMAILCLANDISDLKRRLGNILVAYDIDGKSVFARDLKVDGAMCALLRDAIKPNLVQTLENTPCFMHGGPFANIAHGCNSVRATKLALKLGDYCITEAGFGADLGAEKFLDIKCRLAGLKPDAAVIVATVRALKYNGGAARDTLSEENIDALKRGSVNLLKHIENMKKYGLPAIVAINEFPSDTDAEIEYLAKICEENGAEFAVSTVFSDGGDGGRELAEKLVRLLDTTKSEFKPIYPDDLSIKEKIETIACEIYGAGSVAYTAAASREIESLESAGFKEMPVCIAKTQYSLSDNPKLLGRPEGFEITVRQVRVSAGAGFVVALTGDIMTMPGLPKAPAANLIDVDANGKISGLF